MPLLPITSIPSAPSNTTRLPNIPPPKYIPPPPPNLVIEQPLFSKHTAKKSEKLWKKWEGQHFGHAKPFTKAAPKLVSPFPALFSEIWHVFAYICVYHCCPTNYLMVLHSSITWWFFWSCSWGILQLQSDIVIILLQKRMCKAFLQSRKR